MTSKVKQWAELKLAGNECFKAGQYGEATRIYSLAISELHKSNPKNVEDLSVLHSNRAASYLKEGNCAECLKDCNLSLELVPFNVKSLLRRAAASEAQERYRQAYVDYKTALQLDTHLVAAHEGANRMTKALTEVDGPSWREKLPTIPVVPLAVREKLSRGPPTAPPQHNGIAQNHNLAAEEDLQRARLLKEEGNALVKKGAHAQAAEKYTQSIFHYGKEAATFTNRALCYLALKRYHDAVSDCGAALAVDGANVKALYRRAQAYKELKEMKSCIRDLNKLLEIEPNNTAAIKLLQEVQQQEQQQQQPPQEKKKKSKTKKSKR
ncbi:mitochondrial import receptor subunit TOM34 [Hippocampus zosterae]|uniref:mitochondrial import receptor subunit TOM34 n=1 Tax=Hippocampus zosterae TaxID=109293 RepID=UPI00223DCB3E|nr:mitochondrial import receptor subunit TOM34 [Hippocampus zosterae]